MAIVKFKGEGGLRWTGPSGITYTITSFGNAVVTDERDLKQLTLLGDFDITYTGDELTPKMPSEIPNITITNEEIKEKVKRIRKKKEVEK